MMRYIIGLAARTFDPEGALKLLWREDSETDALTRRVSRVKTLDASVAINDRGYVPGDRTIKLSLQGETEEMVERARRLLKLHSQVTVSLKDGCFSARMSSYDEAGKLLTILVTGVT